MVPMQKRSDISEFLVHFIRGDNYEEAFGVLRSIVADSGLVGGTGFIKEGHQCVCLSEAPIGALAEVLRRPTVHNVPYKPFGVIVTKAWVFEQGGRPVIYQTDLEFTDLPEHLRWRHVRYEPSREPPVDFTWEREWRIRTDFLRISPDVAWLVVPTVQWSYRLATEHKKDQEPAATQYEELTGVPMQAFIRTFPWQVRVLEEPGEDFRSG